MIGLDFRVNGRSRELGVDCVGLLVLASRACELEIEDRPYTGAPCEEALTAGLAKVALQDPKPSPAPGVVGQFYVPSMGAVHVGVFAELAGRESIVHAWQAHGRVLEPLAGSKWAKRLVRTWRHTGLDYTKERKHG